MSEDGAADITGAETSIPSITPEVTPTEVNIQDIIPDTYKEAAWVKDIKDVDGLFKMAGDLKSELGKRPAGVPQDDATPEQWAEFNKALGVPEDANGYGEALGETAEGQEEFHNQVKNLLLESGISKRQAEKLIPGFNKMIEGFQPDLEAQNADFTKLAEDTFGERKDAVMDTARALLAENAPEAFKEHINNLPNKELIVMASVLDMVQQKYIDEGDLPKGGAATAAVSAEERRDKGRQLMASDAFKDAFHPQHAAVKAEVERLYGTGA